MGMGLCACKQGGIVPRCVLFRGETNTHTHKMKTAHTLITDEQRLVGAKTRFGHAVRIYDDGFGPLWIHRDSMGITGIVRAQTWESAYSICEDEFFPAGDEDAAREQAEIEASPEHKRDHLQACWDEAFGFRGNGRREKDGSVSYIYAKDLNGDALDPLTAELVAELGITLEIENE